MRLNNLAGIVLAAGAISLIPQSASSQGIERVVGQKSKQVETPTHKLLFSSLYDRIQQLEFDFRQSNKDSYEYRTRMFENVAGDINRLLLEYGIDFVANKPFSGAVFGTNEGFFAHIFDAPRFNADFYFRRDGSVAVYCIDTEIIEPEMLGFFVGLKPTKEKPKPLESVLVKEIQRDVGFHYFARDDFDEAYRTIRWLREEYETIDKNKDHFRFNFMQNELNVIRQGLLKIHNLDFNDEAFEDARITASGGRILIQSIRSGGVTPFSNPYWDFVIWPNKGPTLIDIYLRMDGSQDINTTTLPQVMRSYNR